MEPVTHILTGACLARAGCNRRAAYATLAMAVAAELPDIDTLASLRGPVEGFQHHRGITHTFIAIPIEAALVVAACYALHKFRLRHQQNTTRPLTAAPIRWPLLYAFTVLALLSHLLLDYTNNYGIRPFFPFNPRWYAGSFVFIFDPLIFLLLLLPLIMPALFGLISSEVGARRQPFRGRAWSIASLTLILALYAFRFSEHASALTLAQSQSLTQPSADPDTPAPLLQPQLILASPDPIDPFLWHIATDFGPVYQLAEANLRNNALIPNQNLFPKPDRTPALLAAEASPLGRAYLDWSPAPILSISPPNDPARPASKVAGSPANTLITFRDPRFMADVPFLRTLSRTPLTGTVELDANNHILRQTLDGRTEH